jgi:hypothetical protein
MHYFSQLLNIPPFCILELSPLGQVAIANLKVISVILLMQKKSAMKMA